MPRYVVAPVADQEIESILSWTHDQFGAQARLRYKALLKQAINDVAKDPELAGSHSRSEIVDSARTYHLFHSRNHVASELGRVKQPRHFLLYRTLADGRIEISRVLHDAVDLLRHIPEDFRTSSGDVDA
jgi:toxin ParE1/3/4